MKSVRYAGCGYYAALIACCITPSFTQTIVKTAFSSNRFSGTAPLITGSKKAPAVKLAPLLFKPEK